MDISKYKEVVQKLSVLKSYTPLLVPVAIVAVSVLVFIPTRLMSGKLKKQMVDGSISMGRKVQSLSRSAVPSGQWEMERDYQLAYESDAKKVALLARGGTQRRLLSYKIFPEPKDTSTLIFEEFGQRFRSAIDELVARIDARDCPTDVELQRSLPGPSASRRDRRDRSGSYSRTSEADAAIIDILCREKAASAGVYVNPADLSGYEFWKEYVYAGMDRAVEACWYYQLAYWIIEDIIDMIDACNSGSKNVLTSPVKRLLGVSFAGGEKVSRSFREKKTEGRPGYVLTIEDGLTEPWTGRVCNDDIDVVHFNVTVVVGAKAVLPFMQRLCSAKRHRFRGFSGQGQEQAFRHNQITILESQIKPVNRKEESHRLYRYGEDAVVELDLVCEYIFNKGAYDEIKPEPVKKGYRVP